jgi:hypothetical protein
MRVTYGLRCVFSDLIDDYPSDVSITGRYGSVPLLRIELSIIIINSALYII